MKKIVTKLSISLLHGAFPKQGEKLITAACWRTVSSVLITKQLILDLIEQLEEKMSVRSLYPPMYVILDLLYHQEN